MLILGFSGGPDPVCPPWDARDERFIKDAFIYHDSAAVLLDNGHVVAAIEEERLNRIKHTNKSASNAIRFCLQSHGVNLTDVDRIVYYGAEKNLDAMLVHHARNNADVKNCWTARSLLAEIFRRDFREEIDPSRLAFVEHHLAHAMSAYALSGFDRSLVLTIDGQGDGLSGTVFVGNNGVLQRLASIPANNSIGDFYTAVIGFLGYTLFDEYKVMGLAPYGDPQRFRDALRELYTLNDDGSYVIYINKVNSLSAILRPRQKGEGFTQEHKDLAAALQEALEKIVFHHLNFYRQQTGEERLCLAGGVAHNCTLNGRILNAGMFSDVFVQPASHDAGCALGAALHVFRETCVERPIPPLKHVYWGTDIGTNDTIPHALKKWCDLVEVSEMEDTSRTTARLLADGYVIGWIQGRSEFGPRALGNRSILADPRPSENKTRINAMVKKREGYRPFAPSVLAEYATQYFEIPEKLQFPYMLFVVNVRPEMRSLLGAVTHVDGTARIQTVSREDNERYWRLITEFHELTGVPIVLNTSFNNNVEPIVDSIDDAITCFLTTNLDYLVIGDFLLRKKSVLDGILQLKLSLPLYVQLCSERHFVSEYDFVESYWCKHSVVEKHSAKISQALHALLSQADGRRSLSELLDSQEVSRDILSTEIEDLWSRRLVVIKP